MAARRPLTIQQGVVKQQADADTLVVGEGVAFSGDGSQLLAEGDAVSARDAGDAAYVVLRGADPVGPNDLVTLEYLEGHAGEVTQIVNFTFESGTMLLQQVFAGDLIDSAWVIIQEPFDDPTATVLMGTTIDGGLIFGAGDVTPASEDQYSNPAANLFSATDFLQLVVTPGLSTQGAGVLVYRYRGG